LVFAPSSLILTNYYLPLSEALYTKSRLEFELKHYKAISLLISLFVITGCMKQSQQEIALEFQKTGKYELLSTEDKSVYTKNEFEKFWPQGGDLSLEPTSKYFEIEKYLKSLITFKIKNAKENEIIITIFYPSVLSEIWFDNLEVLTKKNKDKLENLYLANKKDLLDVSNFKFTEFDKTYLFNDSGIFIDLALVKKTRETSEKINKIRDSVKWHS